MNRAGLAFFLLCMAADAQISVPILGYVPEGPRIRMMQGIPGAGVAGPILATGRDLALIAISPQQDYILATDAVTGEVLKIVPGSAPSASAIAGAIANPDSIVMSPSGSAAVLWFSATNHAQIISGLPATPSIREIDASIPGDSPGAIAVSDDGAWLAAGSFAGTGVYIFGADAAMSAIPLDGSATALAFFHNQATLAIETPTRVSTAALPAGALQTIYASDRTLMPAGLAVSFDNQRIAMADFSGTLTAIDLTGNIASTLDCQCAPGALFGIGGSIFRITDSMLGGVKLFDAENNRVLAVPPALSAALPAHIPSPRNPSGRRIAPDQTAPPLPAVTIGGLPASSGPDQQPAMTVSIASAYEEEIQGTATLTFAPSVGGDDQTIQFGTGGRTVSFIIPPGSTQASFSGASSVVVMTGTTAGTITITVSITAALVPVPLQVTATITLITTPAFINSVQLVQASGGFSVLVTGFSTTRDMVSGAFQFAPSSNATLAAATVTVPLSAAFMTWYSNSASNAVGSQFLLTVPFTTQNGPAADVVAVTVTLTNSKGTSSAVVNQ